MEMNYLESSDLLRQQFIDITYSKSHGGLDDPDPEEEHGARNYACSSGTLNAKNSGEFSQHPLRHGILLQYLSEGLAYSQTAILPLSLK